MTTVDFPISARKPASVEQALAALGSMMDSAVNDEVLRNVLCLQFGDLFFWDASKDRLTLAQGAVLVDFVARPRADAVGHELAMRPTQRFTDLVLVVADLTCSTVDFTEGWPVIMPAAPTD